MIWDGDLVSAEGYSVPYHALVLMSAALFLSKLVEGPVSKSAKVGDKLGKPILF